MALNLLFCLRHLCFSSITSLISKSSWDRYIYRLRNKKAVATWWLHQFYRELGVDHYMLWGEPCLLLLDACSMSLEGQDKTLWISCLGLTCQDFLLRGFFGHFTEKWFIYIYTHIFDPTQDIFFYSFFFLFLATKITAYLFVLVDFLLIPFIHFFFHFATVFRSLTTVAGVYVLLQG